MEDSVDTLIEMNVSGRVLELCREFYDPNIVMISDGEIFAKTMQEAHDKQKPFIESVKEFGVTLLSKNIVGNTSILEFDYELLNADSKVSRFRGRHTQTWAGGKITKEVYETINEA
mgnify:FL=1|tara:strand:+ start:1650 stop:1997 length:348 start_codon:yes stop_codon:yes gene_type:complete